MKDENAVRSNPGGVCCRRVRGGDGERRYDENGVGYELLAAYFRAGGTWRYTIGCCGSVVRWDAPRK